MQFTFGPFTFDGTIARLSRDNAEVVASKYAAR